MNKIILAILMILVCRCGFCEEATFPSTLKVGETVLARAGIGTLSKWFIKGCDMALYAESGTASEAILSDRSKCLEFYYYRNIKAEQFAATAWESLRHNWTEKELGEHKESIDKMHSIYRDVGAGDRYRLLYVPGSGTKLFLNGKELGMVGGPGFAKIYYGIWLGKVPIDVRARDKMVKGLK